MYASPFHFLEGEKARLFSVKINKKKLVALIAGVSIVTLWSIPAALATSQPNLSLTPSVTSATTNQMVLVHVKEDSGTLPVNAVQANVNYPADKLELKYINYTGGSFGIQAEETKTNGQVRIARGRNDGAVTGSQHIATLTFTTKAAGTASLGFASGSVVVNAQTYQSINAALLGATVNVAAPAATPTPTATPSKTPTPSPSASPTASPKVTPSATPSATPAPEQPATLPETGMAVMAGMGGLAVVGTATYAWYRSRRDLQDSLRNK
ncbi:MAG: hypothetical protein K0S68_97 [Candidatus Saccharibacteria bacterium]|jgi:hypothetical protein|nr:hypothetical protein [Candidatus Saccharibacteria bacterium]